MADSYWSTLTEKRITRRMALATSGAATTAAALLAACGSGSKGSSGGASANKSGLLSEPADTQTKAKRTGVMKDRDFADPPTLDVTTPNNPATPFLHGVYSGLVLLKPGYMKPTENEVGPDIAESWETSPDGMTITLKLRQGVKFHNKPPVNGRTMDVDDVIFSWNRFATKYSGRINVANSANPDAPVLSLTAADARTVVLKLKEPLVYALGLFYPSGASGVVLMPKETDAGFDPRGDMIGTGPYMMTSYTPSVGFTFKRNPDFYDKEWPLIEQIDMSVMTEYATALAQMKAGNLYWLGPTTTTDIKPEDVLPLKQGEPRISVYQGDYGVAGLVGSKLNLGWLPVGKSPFLDERVRQAVSMAWDRDLYMDTFFNVSKFRSQGLPVDTRWNTALTAVNQGWWLDPKSKEFGPNSKFYGYQAGDEKLDPLKVHDRNVTEAKKMLSAAGYPNGFALTSHYVTGTELGTTPNHAEVIDGFARELGLTINKHSLDYLKEYVPNFRDGHGQYEGWAYVSTAGGATGGSAIGALASEYWSKGGAAFKGNSTGLTNDQAGDPQLDSLIEKARVEQDTERRRGLVNDIQRYLGKAWYSLPLPGYATGFTVAWPCVGNVRVWQGSRTHYRLWIDDTKPPFKSA